MSDIEFRILELRKAIIDANYRYYDLDEPNITDFEYDNLVRELKELEKKHPEFITKDSPTQKVGGDPSQYLPPVHHLSKMYSLDNIYSDKELDSYREYIKRVGYDPEELDWYCDIKLDGISLSLTYENGEYFQAATRGNGEIGEDITEVVRRSIRNIPIELQPNTYTKIPKTMQLRGECIIPVAVFASKNYDRLRTGEKPLANPRNMVAGLLRRLPSNITDTNTSIKFYCYGSFDMGINNQCGWKTHEEMMNYISKYKINIVPYGKVVKGLSKVKEYYLDIMKIRNTLPMAIDGVVFRINDFSIQNQFGYTTKFPKFAMAYKFPAEKAIGIIEKIIYQVGRTGVITPVAQFNPKVPCNNIIISKATLHNEDVIISKDIRIGDHVVIERSGDVIPKIVDVCKEYRQEHSKKYERITRCPCCGARVIKEDNDAYVYCSNPTCPDKLKAQFTYIVSKPCLNILGMSVKMIEELFNKGYLKHNVLDIFTIDKEKLLDIGIGDIRAEKLVNLINSIKKEIQLSTFLLVLNIPHVGKVTAQELVKHVSYLEDFFNLTYRDLLNIPNMGEVTAEAILNYFHDNPQLLDTVKRLNINIVNYKNKATNTYKCSLTGKKALVTGTFEILNLTREKVHNLITKYGIEPVTSISKADILLVGTKPSPNKIEEANKRNIHIVYEQELISILDL